MLLQEIEALNKKIDKLMNEKTKADAQKEVWESRLKEAVKSYKETYGVDLSDEDLGKFKQKLKAEIDKTSKEISEEYEKSKQLVALIESGDIKGAWALLGVVEEEPKEEEIVEEAEEEVVPRQSEELQGVTSAIDELEDEDFFGVSAESVVVEKKESTPVVEKPKTSTLKTPSYFVMDDDEDEDDEFIVQDTKKEETPKNFIIDDDEDDDDDMGFGSFGSILKGSKFEVD